VELGTRCIYRKGAWIGNSPPKTARAVFLSQLNLNQALVWNVGTCRPDAKGETQMGGPHKGDSTDAGHRDRPTRISGEISVMEMERRGWIIQLYLLVNQQWEEPSGKAKFA
jgi:hypothetical protein